MKKPLFNKICIVGVGLIGGSLGLAIKKRKLARWVVGVTRRKETIQKAFGMGALDIATLDLKEGVKDADLVILCAPISDIKAHLKKIGPYLKRGALVTDVGSSKVEILAAAKKHLKKNDFVGSHPMAGSEKCGIESARASLFEGAVCFISAPHQKIETFWKALGSKPVRLDAGKHDAWAAQASHLPHALSFALLQRIELPTSKKFELNPSFKDLARLAKSHPRIWTDIFLTNREALLKAISSYKIKLSLLERAIRSGSRPAVMRFILMANANAKKVSQDG